MGFLSEQVYKPGSVLDGHLSWYTVTSVIMRSYQGGTGSPRMPFLILLRVGFTEPLLSPTMR